jgi:hypothetical protein
VIKSAAPLFLSNTSLSTLKIIAVSALATELSISAGDTLLSFPFAFDPWPFTFTGGLLCTDGLGVTFPLLLEDGRHDELMRMMIIRTETIA